MSINETIRGKCPSKPNCYQIVLSGTKRTLAKTPSLRKYEQLFFLQCKSRNANVKGLFKMSIKVFYENMRPDLDNSLKVVLDCLQSCNVIVNDRNCVHIDAQKFIDKNDPRIEIQIEELK